jgi:hypothetical protein
MNTLLIQRQHLRDCEAAYKHAQSMLDSNAGNALIQAKQALKEARYAYSEVAMDFVEECIAAQQCEEDWLNIKDVGLEIVV